MNELSLIKKDLHEVDVMDLYNSSPHLFDVRRTGYDGSNFIGPRKQWEQYIKKIPCSLCKVPGGKCKCSI